MSTQRKINSKRPKENPARMMMGTGLGAVVGVLGTLLGTFYATTVGWITADETLRDHIALEIMKSAEPVEKISDKLNWLIKMNLVEDVELTRPESVETIFDKKKAEHVEPTRPATPGHRGRTGSFRQAELAHQYETGGTR